MSFRSKRHSIRLSQVTRGVGSTRICAHSAVSNIQLGISAHDDDPVVSNRHLTLGTPSRARTSVTITAC
jgi:hypothetical protein